MILEDDILIYIRNNESLETLNFDSIRPNFSGSAITFKS